MTAELKKEIKKEIAEFYQENERTRSMVLYHRQILNAALDYGEEKALTDAETGEHLSFAELRRRVFVLARDLHEDYAVEKGDIVICFMPNSIHYPVVFLASALLGACVTGVNPEFAAEDLLLYVRKTRCRCVFTTADLLHKVEQATLGNPIATFVIGKLAGQLGVDFERLIHNSQPVDECATTDAGLTVDDVLLTPLSSGTTGTPKCVMLTHRNFIVQTEVLKEAIFDKLSEAGGRRTTIGVLPLYHASGFWALCYCLLAGHHTVVMQKFQAPLLLSCIEDYKVDTLNLVPSIVSFLLMNSAVVKQFDLRSVTTVLCGSAPMPPAVTRNFLAKFAHVRHFVHGYGMTEIVALSHLSPLDLPLADTKHLTSCGKLLPSFEAKVIDQSGNEITEPHKKGELWLKSECVMKGYLDDIEATDECLDRDGWLHTGDIVYFDEEGFYFVVDRIKNMIKVNGMQVSPIELESKLLKDPFVAEAAVVGVAADGFGEVPRAFVVLNLVPPNLTELIEELREGVNAQLPPYKQLRGGLHVLPSLPRTAAGKVRKDELRRLSLSSASFIHAEASESGLARKVSGAVPKGTVDVPSVELACPVCAGVEESSVESVKRSVHGPDQPTDSSERAESRCGTELRTKKNGRVLNCDLDMLQKTVGFDGCPVEVFEKNRPMEDVDSQRLKQHNLEAENESRESFKSRGQPDERRETFSEFVARENAEAGLECTEKCEEVSNVVEGQSAREEGQEAGYAHDMTVESVHTCKSARFNQSIQIEDDDGKEKSDAEVCFNDEEETLL